MKNFTNIFYGAECFYPKPRLLFSGMGGGIFDISFTETLPYFSKFNITIRTFR